VSQDEKNVFYECTFRRDVFLVVTFFVLTWSVRPRVTQWGLSTWFRFWL